MQLALPDRNVSAADVLHDAAGAAFGLRLVLVVERRLRDDRKVLQAMHARAAAVAIALGAFVILAWQPLQCASAYAARTAAWPALLPMSAEAQAAFAQSA